MEISGKFNQIFCNFRDIEQADPAWSENDFPEDLVC